jgi:hypothetical protein
MIAKPNRMSWAPAPMKRMPTPALGQAQPKTAISSKEVAIATDLAVLTGSALMVWANKKAGNDWSTFWWIASGVMVMKLLHDSSRPY